MVQLIAEQSNQVKGMIMSIEGQKDLSISGRNWETDDMKDEVMGVIEDSLGILHSFEMFCNVLVHANAR